MRYRGNPACCNSCVRKVNCTSSEDGREVRRHVDSWPASESARFHRGISCAVTVLALVWPLASIFTVDNWTDRTLLIFTTVVLGLAAIPLWEFFLRSPADPAGAFVRTLDQTLDDRAKAGEALARRSTTYASDNRPVKITLGRRAGMDEPETPPAKARTTRTSELYENTRKANNDS